MVGDPTLEQVQGLGVRWYLREKTGKTYLVKIVFENGRRREYWIGNVEAIEQVMTGRKKQGPRPYIGALGWGRGSAVAGPAGFEPATTGLGGRRSFLAELRALSSLATCWFMFLEFKGFNALQSPRAYH